MPPTAQVKTRYPQNNLAACMLPWTEDFRLDVAKFQQHVQSTLDGGYKCLYLMGTAGEGYALNDTRFKQVVDLFAAMTVREGIGSANRRHRTIDGTDHPADRLCPRSGDPHVPDFATQLGSDGRSRDDDLLQDRLWRVSRQPLSAL